MGDRNCSLKYGDYTVKCHWERIQCDCEKVVLSTYCSQNTEGGRGCWNFIKILVYFISTSQCMHPLHAAHWVLWLCMYSSVCASVCPSVYPFIHLSLRQSAIHPVNTMYPFGWSDPQLGLSSNDKPSALSCCAAVNIVKATSKLNNWEAFHQIFIALQRPYSGSLLQLYRKREAVTLAVPDILFSKVTASVSGHYNFNTYHI
jgi:hypothetical protein